MFTIIGGDGKEYGPATAEQLRGWITAGRANLETKARADGETEWRRLGDFPAFGGSAAPAEPPPLGLLEMRAGGRRELVVTENFTPAPTFATAASFPLVAPVELVPADRVTRLLAVLNDAAINPLVSLSPN